MFFYIREGNPASLCRNRANLFCDGQAQGLLLEDVRDPGSETTAVAYGLAGTLPCLRGDDDTDVGYSRLDDLLQNKKIGRLATGMSCLVVRGRRRVPLLLERMRDSMG